MLNSSISSTCPHNMVNFGPLAAEIGWRVWGTPTDFNGFASWLRYCSDVAQRRSTKLYRMFDHLVGWYTIYTSFWGRLGAFALTEFCQMQSSFCVPVLRCPILAALLHGIRAVSVSQTLRRGTMNGIKELSLLVIFNRRRHLYSEGGHHVGHRPTF